VTIIIFVIVFLKTFLMGRMKNKLRVVYLTLKFIVSMETNCVRKLYIILTNISSVLLSNVDGSTSTSESLN
jgi:hypothetical protein